MMALLQKMIFDIVFGIYIATAGMNLYAVFDFITFQETLENSLEEKKSQNTNENSLYQFHFALQSNVKMALIIFALG
jgi:hypothetical protein